MKHLLAFGFVFLASISLAQDITNHSMPVGGGPGAVGWKEAGPCAAGQALVWSSVSTDPQCTSVSGSGSTPGGSNLNIQYNNAGTFGGLTDTQVTARINVATTALKGALPAWPNNTTTYFRGDGTYATIAANSIAPSGFYNVRYYGAVGDGSTNDTTAVQAAVTAACAVGGAAFFPPGIYAVDTINASGCTLGLAIVGSGPSTQGTRILSRGASSLGTNFIDFSGTTQPVIRDVRVVCGTDASNTVKTGLLVAPISGGSGIDIITIDNVFFGCFATSGSFYCYGCTSSGWKKAVFWNYLDGASSLAGVFTRVNAQGITSANQTLASGDQGGSDLSCFSCEWHHHKQAGGATTNATIYIGGIVNFAMYGGNVAGSGARLISSQVENSVSSTRWIFSNVTYYSENGTDPTAVFGLDTGISGLDLNQNSKPAGTTWFNAGSATFYTCTGPNC